MKFFVPCQLFASAFLVIFFIGVGIAQSDDNGSVAVQVNPLAITATTVNGYTGRTIVTPYSSVANAKALPRLCGRLPRLTEVILIAFNETPADIARLKEHIAERQDEFKTQIESVIGVGVFNGFYATVGAYKRVLAEVDGGTQACQPIEQFHWDAAEYKAPKEIKPVPEVVIKNDAVRKSPLSESELAAA